MKGLFRMDSAARQSPFFLNRMLSKEAKKQNDPYL